MHLQTWNLYYKVYSQLLQLKDKPFLKLIFFCLQSLIKELKSLIIIDFVKDFPYFCFLFCTIALSA